MTAERMHGCGHDGHTCIALGAAQLLLQRQNFNGTVCFVFSLLRNWLWRQSDDGRWRY